MAPFYSGPLIGRQCVSGGRGAGCHVLCLMLCAVLRWRETMAVWKVCSSIWPQCYRGHRGVRPINCLTETWLHTSSQDTWEGGAQEGSWVWNGNCTTVLWYNEHIQSVRIKISPLAAWKGEVSSSQEKSIRNRSFWRDMCVTVNRS